MATKVKLIADGVITPDQITLTTASTGTNTTAPATTAFVQQEISALVDSSPDALNTLNELAAALGDDANFSTTVTNSIATKLPLAGGSLTGALDITAAGNQLTLSRSGFDNILFGTGNVNGQVGFHITNSTDSIVPVSLHENAPAATLVVDSTGNVGIGTDSPNGKLTISNSGAGGFEFTPDTTAFSVTNSNYIASYDRSASAYRDIVFDLGGVENQSIRFKAGGNVGIGTSSPVSPLQVNVGTNLNLGVNEDSSTLRLSVYDDAASSSQPMTINSSSTRFDISGTERMRINSTGVVSIGNTENTGYSDDYLVQVGTDGSGSDSFGMLIRANQSGTSKLGFADGADADATGKVWYDHSSNYMRFDTAGSERMRIDSSGIKLPHDHFYSQEISHHGHNNFPTSYSASSAYTYSDNTNRYAYGPTGEKLVANVTARAYTNYIHLKTNLIANNIMFYVRTKGYFYGYGVEEILMGGYTYNNTQVLNKSFETIAGGTHNGGNNDLYRASSGSNLIIKIQLGHTDYTEGQMVVLFHSHGMDSSVMRDFRIIEVKTQNDGTNPY